MAQNTRRRGHRRGQTRPERKPLTISQAVRDKIESGEYIPTIDQIKVLYGPAKTLGAPQSAQLAMDAQLNESGAYTLLQHAFQMGQFPSLGPSFMGYAALSSLTQNGLIRACIETVADDMTREWIEIDAVDENQNGDDSDERKTLEDAMIDYRVRDISHKAAEFNGYFGGAMIFIDTGAKGDQLLVPLDISEKSAELKNFKRFTLVEPINLFPGNYESLDPLNPHYFVPQTWWVLGKQVHVSRLIPVCGNEVPVILKPTYNFFGIPQAQILYDYVIHFQDARAAESRLLEKFSIKIVKTDMQDVLTNPNATSGIDARIGYMTAYMSNDGVLALDKDMEDFVNVSVPLNGVTDIVRQQLEFIVAINRTPAVKLLGISPAGFNTGDSDIKNYNDHISSQQEKVLRTPVQKMLDVLQIVKLGKYDKSVSFKFKGLNEEDEKAIADAQDVKASTRQKYLQEGVVSQGEVRKALSEDPHSGFYGIDAEAVPEGNDDEEETENSLFNPTKRGTGSGVQEEAQQAD
ncbi:anti-CBASS protein Acb1 family protein [Enterobacter roggenkampii]|uniref:anti-CBASS protein Acb1 family protein n=1 Tax=Enterobacter roggenkampii TaxID=1812935 RepID=UPI0039C2922E